MKNIENIVKDLEFFKDQASIGTMEYHRFSVLFSKIVLTDGAKIAAEKLSAYWLMDIIGSYKESFDDRFNSAYCILNEEGGADFYLVDGDYNVVVHQNVPFTDLKENVHLFVMPSEEYYVIMLPSEY